MSISDLATDVANASTRPKGIKVSPETWNELKNSSQIKMKDVGILGTIDLEFQFPYYDEDIYIIVDPDLEDRGLDYELPSSSNP